MRRAVTTGAILLVLSSILVMTGCVVPAFSPPRPRVAEISRLVVVPVEPPPLQVTDYRLVRDRGLGESIIVGTPSAGGGGALVALGGVVMLIDWAASGKDPITRSHERFMSLSDLLTKGLVWSPTRELAEEATAQLRSSANGRLVTTSPMYRMLPIENRGRTWHMENWLRPIRAWYAEETAGTDLQVEPGTDTLLELSLSNYEWHTHRFVVQVMMRLVDVRSGRVIGRTRDWAYPEVGRAVELLANDSAGLKTVFVNTARPLVAAGLKDLGLIDHLSVKRVSTLDKR
jgi:hypothetical protein